MVATHNFSNTMLHRTQLFRRLSTLTTWRFVSYIERIDSSTHIVKFYVPNLISPWLSSNECYLLLRVRECNGYLSGETLCGSLTCEKLT